MDQGQWEQLMGAMDLPSCLDCYHALCQAYDEPHRHYHTKKHIAAMLSHFSQVSHQADNPTHIAVAIWFHDAIYKPLSKRNESDSAKWAESFLSQQGVDATVIANVCRLIMVTVHGVALKANDEMLMVDIDLTILGALPAVYDEFELNIRREYRRVPSFMYRRKRKALLQMFLAQPRIYHTDYFYMKFEALARQNLQRALELL